MAGEGRRAGGARPAGRRDCTASTCRGRASAPTAIDGEVLRVDRFGNLITNIDRRTFDRLARAARSRFASARIAVSRVVSTYADARPGEVCALFGSTDHLEIAVNGASAARALALGRGPWALPRA